MPSRPLTVLQVLPALDSGGVERGTLDVGRALVAAGHRSLVMSAGGRLVPKLLAEGSEHLQRDVGRKSLATLRHIWPLRRVLGSEGIDVVHVRSRLPAWIVWLAWRSLPRCSRPRLVTTVHGPNSVSRYSEVMTFGERVIAASAYIDAYISQHYAVETPRIRVIPRGVDPEEFSYGYEPPRAWLEETLKEFPEFQGKRLLLIAGRITRLKGHEHFLELVRRLVETGEPVHGVMVGDVHAGRESYGKELTGLVRSYDLSAHITQTGHRSDIRNWLAIADVVYTLSRVEAFGRTTAEALSLGRPTIGFETGGTTEILKAIYPAGLVPLGDMDALVARTREFLRAAPPVPPNQPFTLQRMTDATLAVYQELVDSPR